MNYGNQSFDMFRPQQGSIIWVLGEEGAKSYLVAPGQTVPLWDSEKPIIYLKTVDVYGRPSMTIIDYQARSNQSQAQTLPGMAQNTNEEYITKKEFEEFARRIEGRLNNESTLSKTESK